MAKQSDEERRKYQRDWYHKKYPNGHPRKGSKNHLNQRYSDYRGHAVKLGYEFTHTFEEFKAMIALDCIYCGTPNTIDNPNGLDRVDSNQGYLDSNIVTCCTVCNYMKRRTPADDFIAHCKKIAAHQTKNPS